MKYQHRVLGLLSLLAIITYLDRVCIAVAGPRMQDSLHISPQAWGWVMTAFFFSYSVFEIPSGILGDRIGPRRVLTRIVLWWSAFTSLTGTVTSYPVLVLVRFCFGAGEAGAYPNAAVVIRRWMPAGHRARAWGVVWMMSQLGGALSPLIVVPIQMRYGWQASFYVFGVIGVIWGGVWYWWFRDSPAEKPGVTAAEIAEIGTPDGSLAHHGLPWRATLRSGNLWRAMGIAACYVYVLTFYQSWFQTYLVKGRGFSEVNLMLSSLPYVVGAAGNLLGGFASDWLSRLFGLKAGRRTVGVVGLGVAMLSLIATLMTANNTLALVFLSLVYGGMTFQQPNVSAVCLDIGGRHAGAILGFMNSAANAAGALSSVIFGYLVAHFDSYTIPLIPMVLALGVGTVLWLTVDPTRELFAAKEEPAGG
jgi:ACS family glucarate transporter-like MFS transporter